MRRPLNYLGLFLTGLILLSCSVQQDHLANAPLKLELELLTSPDYNGSGETLSVLTIHNQSQDTLHGDWVLYYNGHGVLNADTAGAEVDVNWINGDFNEIRPTTIWLALAPGATKEVSLKMRNLRNMINIPRGLYLVSSDYPEGVAVDFHLKPNAHLDAYEARVAADIYERNARRIDREGELLPPVFPTPATYTLTSGSFDLSGDVVVEADAAFGAEAQYLQDELFAIVGKKPVLTDAPKEGQSLISLRKKEGMGAEAYHLVVTDQSVSIEATTPAGAFYGVQSLKSMIHPAAFSGDQQALSGDQVALKLPGVEIKDEPRFGHRAFMLDVSRNFQPKTQILKLLDLMATYKLNVFHFHLTEDEGWRLEIPGLPELTEVGAYRGHTETGLERLIPAYGTGPNPSKGTGSGYYTRQDFIEILQYAQKRHITVIPEIETPGHARAAVKSMESRYHHYLAQGDTSAATQYLLSDPDDASQYRSAQVWTDNVMNVALPSVYTFMEKVIDEMIAMYKDAGVPLETVHIGGDEVPNGVWEKSPAVDRFLAETPQVPNVDELWHYYLENIHNIMQQRGLYVYGWEEIGMKKALVNGRKTMVVEPRFGEHGFQVDVWNNVGNNVDLAYRLANAGYQVVLTNVTNFYYDLAYHHGFYEMGHNWGGLVDVEKSFRFIPFDYYKSIVDDRTFLIQDQSKYKGFERLTERGKANIVGLQAPLWTEFVSGEGRMEYMLLPKLLGLVERAWAPASEWEEIPLGETFEQAYRQDWSVFLDRVGEWELPRLDKMYGGFNYRIPTPGVEKKGGQLFANVQFPGLEIRYTTDGSAPTTESPLYTQPIAAPDSGTVIFKTFNQQGRASDGIKLQF